MHEPSPPTGTSHDFANGSFSRSSLERLGRSDTSFEIRPVPEYQKTQVLRLRHDTYAAELGQHPVQANGILEDRLDAHNLYLGAFDAERLAGFITVTPPGPHGYSLDKYLTRAEFPVKPDAATYEVRLLTVAPAYRDTGVAVALMHAALVYIERAGGKTIVGMGRRNLMAFYAKAGLRGTGKLVRSGEVAYEVMVGDVRAIAALARDLLADSNRDLAKANRGTDRGTNASSAPAFHGGRSIHAIWAPPERPRPGQAVSADVLDAWFEPAPEVIEAVTRDLPWALRSSPSADAEALEAFIAAQRGLPPHSVLAGGGSTELIHRVLGGILGPGDRVGIVDPSYSEYPHLLSLRKCVANPIPLSAATNFAFPLDRIHAALSAGQRAVVLVNPNNPTGSYISAGRLEELLQSRHPDTLAWIDETYVDFVPGAKSLERFASQNPGILVCKSMSKAYALSGCRVGYIVGHPSTLASWRASIVPWNVSSVATLAAAAALRAGDYFQTRWTETGTLAAALRGKLERLGCRTWGTANFLLCQLPKDGPDAPALLERMERRGVFIRSMRGTGHVLGDDMVRVAVRGSAENERIIHAFGDSLK